MIEGWDSIDSLETEAPDRDEPSDQDVIDKLHVAVFNTPHGMRFLAYLKRTYLDKPVFVPGVGTEVGFMREGENNVVRDIHRRLIRGLMPK